MTVISEDIAEPIPAFSERLRKFRNSRGMTRAALASGLGVSPMTLYRWEVGSARPSPTAAAKLASMGFGEVAQNETNVASVPRLKAGSERPLASRAADLRTAGRVPLALAQGEISVLTAPFVRNGPPDQVDFHKKLLHLQVSPPRTADAQLLRRLSLVEDIEGFGITAQHALDSPRPTAVSWNSNYGPHGWHRYVGRFPPHVVRALLNHFGAGRETVILDPFAGSGTTAVECRLLGIPFVGIEICPLSCLMTRTKAAFPADPALLERLAGEFSRFYGERWDNVSTRASRPLSHSQILSRPGNSIPAFANVERWYTAEALLGVSITVEFAMSLEGFARDAVMLALSSKMRSIGNVDVDVVRAEYSKNPRTAVDARHLVVRQLRKMAADIARSLTSHAGLIGPETGVVVHEGSVLDVDLPEGSVDHVITSPPYGVEAISYLRTHLLSYRALHAYLGHDPYETRDKTIGSEYLTNSSPATGCRSADISSAFRTFFSACRQNGDSKLETRRDAMMQFFDDMLTVGERLARWLRDGGQVAFIVGNKRLGEDVIPTDAIIKELFAFCGLTFQQEIQHKLKTNNSNSQVPWQERIIQEESILLFQRQTRCGP